MNKVCTGAYFVLLAYTSEEFFRLISYCLSRDAKFWDAIANRKSKARKRRSRKFISSSQDQFSILDEPIPNSESAQEEALKIPPSPVPAKSANTSGMSDTDLIMLLGKAEEDDATNDPSPSADYSSVTPVRSATIFSAASSTQSANKVLMLKSS
jgi:hypothetical protein